MSSENDSEMDCSDSDCGDPGYEDYYNIQPWGGDVDNDVDPEQNRRDPEYAVYDCLRVEEVERLLNESVEVLSNSLHVTPSLAKVLLHAHDWASQDIVTKYRTNASSLLISSKIKPTLEQVPGTKSQRGGMCSVCIMVCPADKFSTLTCGHSFCKDCWCMHFEVQIMQGISTGVSCMAQDCDVLVPEDFVLSILTKPNMRERYQQFTFCDYVRSHPQLRFCPGPNCQIVLRSKEQRAKRVMCSSYKTVFCFRCGMDYHAPTDCSTIKKWLTKCADDFETANYISAHTKDCPKCHICIEKNGGCNHMQCYNCKHDFCWMCLGDLKAHGSEYYECSRYKENPNIAHESVHVQAREALKKYLHYYEQVLRSNCKTLLRCQLVCKRWKYLIVDALREKATRTVGKPFPWDYDMPLQVYYLACEKKPYGRNLIKNHSGAEGEAYWSYFARIHSWRVEEPSHDMPMLPHDESLFNNRQICFATTTEYNWCTIEQTINFMDEGIIHKYILKTYKPPIVISEWYGCPRGRPVVYRLQVLLYDDRFKVMDRFEFRDNLEGDKQNRWLNVSHVFQNYKRTPLRIEFQHNGEVEHIGQDFIARRSRDSRVESASVFRRGTFKDSGTIWHRSNSLKRLFRSPRVYFCSYEDKPLIVITMTYLSSWEEFERGAERLYLQDPINTRYTMKYCHSKGVLCLKLADNRRCLQYRTEIAQDLKKMEKFIGNLMRHMASKDS